MLAPSPRSVSCGATLPRPLEPDMAGDAATSEVINRGMVTATVMLATLMQALDTTIANVALPYMQGSLSATSDQINWVLTSYIVAAAIITPATGGLGGGFGLKTPLPTSVVR